MPAWGRRDGLRSAASGKGLAPASESLKGGSHRTESPVPFPFDATLKGIVQEHTSDHDGHHLGGCSGPALTRSELAAEEGGDVAALPYR